MKQSLLREGDWAGIITMAIGLAALQKPGFPAHSRVSWGSLAEHMNGWLTWEGSNSHISN
jgi:hypothetical protein